MRNANFFPTFASAINYIKDMYTFSFFRRPVRTVTPCRGMTLKDLLKYCTSQYARDVTDAARQLSIEERRGFKKLNFDFCTPACTCSQRKTEGITALSGLMVIDIDHVPAPRELLYTLLPTLRPLFAFVSPSGEGLKVLRSWCSPRSLVSDEDINESARAYKQEFSQYSEWLNNELRPWGASVDPSGSDLARACYLCYDPFAYLDPREI